MDEIVAGVDDSEYGLVAVEWAATEAARRGAPLRVVYAIAPRLFDLPAGPRSEAIRKWTHANGEAVVEQALGRAVAAAPRVKVSGRQVGGRPADVLIKESGGAAMVVVGGHGAGGPAGLLPGSVALRVISHASCPAVAVHLGRPVGQAGEPAAQEPAAEAPAAGVVVGVDCSPGSAAALEFAFGEAALRGTSLRAVLAWTQPLAEDPRAGQTLFFEPEVVTEECDAALADFAAGCEAEHPDVPFRRQVVHARPAPALAEASASAELLVVGTRGRGGFTGLLLGSVGHAMLHRARCPVAVVPDRRR
ncbi:universal stress protein [Actinomadura rugatobispora]|uniref:Universal stress protein n=1 Tax=Actinomadura rugatobispora TaxID=1994 RepID=A0ABW1A0H9_9ACTN